MTRRRKGMKKKIALLIVNAKHVKCNMIRNRGVGRSEKKRENTSHMRVLQRALKNSSANRVCMCARVAFFFFFAQFIRCSASIYNIAPTANHRQENVCDETIRWHTHVILYNIQAKKFIMNEHSSAWFVANKAYAVHTLVYITNI